MKQGGKPKRSSLNRITLWEILSKALLKSVAITSTSKPFSKAQRVLETKSVRLVTVDLPLRKPCWKGEKMDLQWKNVES